MPIHPHMLRHGCGFKLANQGIDTRSIRTPLILGVTWVVAAMPVNGSSSLTPFSL